MSFVTVQWKAIKAILIGFALTGINLFSGTFAMINYTSTIFAASGSTLDPNISSIVVAAIQIFGVYGSTILVDRIGRKTLLIFSTSGSFIGLLSLGIYSYLNDAGYDLTSCNWIPLISFSTFVFISCFGILPLPFIVLTEILPAEVKSMKYEKWHIFLLLIFFTFYISLWWHALINISFTIENANEFFICFIFSFFILCTGADVWIDDLHALQQYIRIHFTQDVPNVDGFRTFVRSFMDLLRRLLRWYAFRHFHSGRNEREEFEWMQAKNYTNN